MKPLEQYPLKIAREARGWSQAKVAEVLGVALSTVGRWERRVILPHPYYREQLSTLFGKTVEELGLVSNTSGDDPVPEAPLLADQQFPENADKNDPMLKASLPFDQQPPALEDLELEPFLTDLPIPDAQGATNSSWERYGIRLLMSLSLPGLTDKGTIGNDRVIGNYRFTSDSNVNSDGRHRLPVGQIQHGRSRLLELAFLCSVVAALISYAFWQLGIFTLDMHLYPTKKITPAAITRTTNVIATPTSYEAEAPGNRLIGGTKVLDCSFCSGGKMVGYIGGHGILQFNAVNKIESGNYILTMYYVFGGTHRNLHIRVNGGPLGPPIRILGLGSWNVVGTSVMTVRLNAGKNSIEFSNSFGSPSIYGINIDRIVV